MSAPTTDKFVRGNFQLSDSYDYKNHVEKLNEFAKIHVRKFAESKLTLEEYLKQIN